MMEVVISVTSKETFNAMLSHRLGTSYQDLIAQGAVITAGVSPVNESLMLSVPPATGAYVPVEHATDGGDFTWVGVQVGPGSAIGTLVPGTYDVWFRVQNGDDDVRFKCPDHLVIY
jgi:hypothetical protein